MGEALPVSNPPLIRLDTLTSKPLTWLWRPRLPAGRLSLLVGHPDRGKSLVACTFAAHVTRERLWPDGAPCAKGTVLFLESEDSLEETVLPRLHAADADLRRMFTWSARNLAHLNTMLKDLRPQLAVLSPLNTYLPKANTWVDQEVRKVLQPLADLASETNTAILGVMHPPKARYVLPIHALAGSIAFGAVARSVLTVERGEDGLHLLESVKQNLTDVVPPIGYRIRSWAGNHDIAQLMWEIVPETLSFIPPDDEQSSLATACEYVRMALADGAVASTDLKEAAERNGIAWRAIERARKVLQIQAVKVGKGKHAHWELSLPRKNGNI